MGVVYAGGDVLRLRPIDRRPKAGNLWFHLVTARCKVDVPLCADLAFYLPSSMWMTFPVADVCSKIRVWVMVGQAPLYA
ncbi:hypothetical protein Y032_0002g692 [Ancylostoma ceylanicum]|uniref:Uncharacterized protein n=1 Tax=Ancylostoma ceylanicum TaxID=53326 RepID=A0A016W2N5_9BILA|nr:hypothetical protein Y032_0002g692 [Ancylostoma ceylanicum]